MKHRSLPSALLAATLLSFATQSNADVIVMKDGKKYEDATILSQTADSVTFKYMLTPRIPDTRTEKKADVAQWIKQRPEELAIVPLRKLLPTPDLLTADKYEAMIQDKLRPFISQYPGSPEAKEAETIVATLNSEKEQVVSGHVKMDGKWLAPDQAKRDGHNIDAYRVRREMNDAAAKNDYREALKAWDKLISRDNGFTDTEQYIKAVPEVLKIMADYKKELDSMHTQQPLIQKRRDDSLKSLQEPDLSRTKRAIDAEMDSFKSEAAAEKAAQVRWTAVYRYDMKAIDAARKLVTEESAKLSSVDLSRISSIISAIADARAKIEEQDVAGATAALTTASASLTGLRDSSALSSSISKLKTAVSALKLEQSKKKATTKTFTRPTALSTPTTPGTDAAPAPTPAETKPEAKDDGKGEPKDDKKDAKSKAASASEAKKKSALIKQRAASASQNKEEEGMSFSTMLVGGGAAVLAVLGGVMFMQKRKQSA